MQIQRLAVTGDEMFLQRHGDLIEALRASIPNVDTVATGNYFKVMPGILEYIYYRLRYAHLGGDRWHDLMLKSSRAFQQRSRQAAGIVNALPNRPDHVLHIHAMYVPVVPQSGKGPSYSIFTDYTGAQCARNWEPWSPHTDPKDAKAWIDSQRIAYEGATKIFVFSDVTGASVRDDYGIPREKVTVVGHAGDSQVLEGRKTLGSKKLLINGSDWIRKGADIAVEAMRIVHDRIPEANLRIMGCAPRDPQPGVEYLGVVHGRDKVHQLLKETDILLSPARCDPLPTAGVEAMGYGVPVIVSDRDGMPEMIDYGTCGSIAKLDAASVAEEIVRLLEDDALLRAKSDAAIERVRSTYNWDHIAGLMIDSWKSTK